MALHIENYDNFAIRQPYGKNLLSWLLLNLLHLLQMVIR